MSPQFLLVVIVSLVFNVESKNLDRFCTLEYEPVCSVTGQTFSNICHAGYASIACTGECPCDGNQCVCQEIFSPVCSFSGKTYENECKANCKKDPVKCSGRCPCDSNQCICQEIFSPVCAVSGTTYENECKAGCKNDLVACSGSCPCDFEPCDCCGGVSPLPEECARTTVNCQSCNQQCSCRKNLDYVCSVKGVTYQNECRAKCANDRVACNGKCPCKSTPIDACDCCGSKSPKPEFCQRVRVDCRSCPVKDCICTTEFAPVCTESGKTRSNECVAKCFKDPVACTGSCPCADKPPFDICDCCSSSNGPRPKQCQFVRVDCRTCNKDQIYY